MVSGGVDRAPLASAGPDATVTAGAPVALDGSASRDLDRDPLTFQWMQTGGPEVALEAASEPVAAFTPAINGTYTFQLIVSDGFAQAKDIVVVRVADKTVVFSDDFETDRGWRRNPTGKDSATLGLWERATPQPTASSGTKQLGTAVSGRFDLVTGTLAGLDASVNDVDGGVTSIQSPVIIIPPEGIVTLSLSYYFAHLDNASAADFFRVRVVGETAERVVIEELGSPTNRDAVFVRPSIELSELAGQSVRIVIEAADLDGASLIEAAVDDVVIEHQ